MFIIKNDKLYIVPSPSINIKQRKLTFHLLFLPKGISLYSLVKKSNISLLVSD